jgi:ABC-type antimicrobial peptide transport system permease subunit
MTEAAFPVNDLFRRRLQSGLTVLSLTTSVASTLFLLLFSGQIGFGIAAVSRDTLTSGTSSVFAQFLTFVGSLIFIVGAVIVSFIVFLMMAQRTKDFGLMKATGCPNSLVFGYFVTELLGITFVGCLLGVIVGFATDYIVINMPMFQVYNSAPNFWFAPLVFAVYFAFALALGAKPLFDAAKMSPLKALSSVQYFGLGKGAPLKPLSRTGLTLRIASRSLFRRKSATLRLVIFLSTVFLLLTVSIAGGIIASDTSSSWVQQATGKNVVLIADQNMANQYKQLLLTYSGAKENADFNYSEPNLSISSTVIDAISQISGVQAMDSRLIVKGTVQEVAGFKVDPDTLATIPIGDNRQCESLLVGINAGNIVTEPLTTGFFLNATSGLNAVVGDSISTAIYSAVFSSHYFGKVTTLGDALVESARIGNFTFKISGICLDPINNGNVTYIPLPQLKQITGISDPNIVLVQIRPTADYAATMAQIQTKLQTMNPALIVMDLNAVTKENVSFLNSLWSVIMFLPAFALAAAALCLVSFLMISIDEQHQEFAILRATGAKPSTVLVILAAQSLTVLLSSFGVGASIGTIVCIIILTAHPVVSAFTVVAISGWLLTTLLIMFLISLYPVVKFARKPLPEIMS